MQCLITGILVRLMTFLANNLHIVSKIVIVFQVTPYFMSNNIWLHDSTMIVTINEMNEIVINISRALK
jgi:hypothetical protein